MLDYKAVPSGLDIGRRVAYYLETMTTQKYLPTERDQAIHAVNDILQGRSQRAAEELLAQLKQYGNGHTASVQQDIQDFLAQRDLLTRPYAKSNNSRRYVFRQHIRSEGRSLKVIDQKLYDQAVRQGFPSGFFRESHFDQVTFYCLPDTVDFYGSELHSCKFAVCRIKSISFGYTRIFDTEFYSCVLNRADFYEAVLVHAHFRDCELSHVMMQTARLKGCSTIDCTMDDVDYAGATLDSCSFGRVTARNIQLNYATITQGGATEEECRQNRQAIYQVLGVTEVAA